MNKFQDLKVWQKAMEVTVEVYKSTSKFPEDEKKGLAQQMRNSSIAIPTFLAEGSWKRSNEHFINLINKGISTSFELETQLILSKDLKLTSPKAFETLHEALTDVQKMLYGLRSSLYKKNQERMEPHKEAV